MYSYSIFTATAEQQAQFSAFFVRHREHFSQQMGLDEALVYLLSYLEQSSLVLSYNERNELIAAMNYWRTSDEEFNYDPDGETIYISSALIAANARSTRVFMQGFRDAMNYMHRQAPQLKSVAFTARTENPYINALYGKLASYCGQQEGMHGMENVYKADFNELRTFLNRLKSK